MAVLNPTHLFEQAEKLIQPLAAGPPRQVDLRRAISATYYGLFHFVLTASADEFVGVTQRTTKRYALVYRSIDHRRLREVCVEVQKSTPAPKVRDYMPHDGMGRHLPPFAGALIDLQEKRHSMDYDPSIRVTTADAKLALATARAAVHRFERVRADRRRMFLTLVLFQPR